MEVSGRNVTRNGDLGNDGITALVDHERALRAREVMRPVAAPPRSAAQRTLAERASGKVATTEPAAPVSG